MKKSGKKSFDHWLTTAFMITITMGLILFCTSLYTLHIRKHLPQPPQVSVTTVSTTVRGVDVDRNRVTASLNVGFLLENTEKKGMIVDHVTLSASQLINHKKYLTIAKSDSPVAIVAYYQSNDFEEDDYYDTKWFSLENVTAEVEHWDVVYGEADGDSSSGMHSGQESGVFYVDFALTYDVTYKSGNIIIPWSKQRTIGMEVGCEGLKVQFSSNETTTTMDYDGRGGGLAVFRSRCSSIGEDVLEKVGDWLFIQGTFLLSISIVLFYCSILSFFFKFFVLCFFIKTRESAMYRLF